MTRVRKEGRGICHNRGKILVPQVIRVKGVVKYEPIRTQSEPKPKAKVANEDHLQISFNKSSMVMKNKNTMCLCYMASWEAAVRYPVLRAV